MVFQPTPPGTHIGLISTFQFMAHAYFTIEAMICGFHIYRDIWSTVEASDTGREPLQTVCIYMCGKEKFL